MGARGVEGVEGLEEVVELPAARGGMEGSLTVRAV